METLDNQFVENTDNNTLQVTSDMKTNWLSTSKWAMFFAVLGFIGAGISLLSIGVILPMMRTMMALGGSPELAALVESAGALITIVLVIGTIATFFVSLFHMRFASRIQRAMQFDDQNAFESAWHNLRNHFRLYGILVIAYIVLYLIAILAITLFVTPNS